MITVFHRPADEDVLRPSDIDSLSELRSKGGWVWVDVLAEDFAEITRVSSLFDFDELAVEDTMDETHFPKVDEYPGYLFVVLHGLAEEDGRISTIEVDSFIGPDYLVTVHFERSSSIDWLMEKGAGTGALAAGGPDLMLARIAEVQGRRFLPIIETLDQAIDDLEERAMHGDPVVVPEIQALRRDASNLRRVIGPLRETLLELSRPLSEVVGERARVRFASVFDHCFRVVESLDSSRALLGAVLETYRSTVAERMNEIMKVLTVYTAILLPLTLLAGIYGMNFANMPELGWRYGYLTVVGVMSIVAIGQWVYFSRRGFIGRFRPPKAVRAVGVGLGRVARLPIDAASFVIRAGRPSIRPGGAVSPPDV